MRPTKSLRILSLSSALAVLVALSCESGNDDEAPKSLTRACDSCLSREACSAPFESCREDADCERYIACVLRADCYSSAPASGCEERAGCELETASIESQNASDDFETCARTECAATCGFVTP